MAAYTPVAGSRAALAKSVNVATDSWAIALSNTAPSSTTFSAGTTDLATGGGYTAGGTSVGTAVSTTETTGVLKVILNSPTAWTANTTGIGPFRYVLLVDTTAAVVLGYWDYGSAITLNGSNSDTFTVTLDGTNGVFTVS